MKFMGIEPSETGIVHFVGIGGIGMSGIAMVMHRLGYRVQGSDTAESGAVKRLQREGIHVYKEHAADNIKNVATVVVSTAIPTDNVEVSEARRRRIPVVQRARMLAELMRFKFGIAVAGTHGKTTVTSLLSHLLTTAKFDPTYVIGGCVKSTDESSAVGSGDYLVVEADESDGSFLFLNPTIAVVTNIDNDHLDTYEGEFKQLEAAFTDFIERVPFYGVVIACRDDNRVSRLCDTCARRFITYGLSEDSDVKAKNIRHINATTQFEVEMPWRKDTIEVTLNLPGYHNVLNALAVIGVARELKIDDKTVLKALKNFGGIARRFHIYPDLKLAGGVAHLVDDYGHHPTEIAATLDAVDKTWPNKRKVIIFQPHRYTRTGQLFERFVEVLRRADELILLDIYSAGEEPIESINSHALGGAIHVHTEKSPTYLHTPEDVPPVLKDIVKDDDVVVVLGAGTIGRLAPQLREEFSAVA